ncbi:COX15/CtaA family protein [Portibacter marinus]|uniref:COX15/CtaA family protein n=1 Tax=Portibacter marinus TaxID=2898660 RepID=UPI001F406943|nr:COX15/CtaA family protein [Portibacter marinus]
MSKEIEMEVSKWVKIWLYVGLIMLMGQIIIGGITRLTGSGLSITKWEIVTGTLPPTNEAAWEKEFDLYKETPQYAKINEGMSMKEFKFIYFWEYFHRLWARAMGIVFMVPFIVFAARKMLPRSLMWRLGLVVLLAALAASFGWIMVASGLVNRPWVNAYKLTLHLSIGISVFIALYWAVLNVEIPIMRIIEKQTKSMAKVLVTLLIIQILLGGLMSGMKAALFYPTWPDMNGMIIPQVLFNTSHWNVESIINYDTNPFISALVQVLHRTMAYIVFGYGLYFAWKLFRKNLGRYSSIPLVIFVLLLLVQVLLGIITLVMSKGSIPVFYGVMHQGFGILLLASAVYFLFMFRKKLIHP